MAKSKWLKFIDHTQPKKNKSGKIVSYPKTNTYLVRNKESGFALGWIRWYGPFRQYSFFPEPDTVFEKTCMKDITDFIVNLMEERKLSKVKIKETTPESYEGSKTNALEFDEVGQVANLCPSPNNCTYPNCRCLK